MTVDVNPTLDIGQLVEPPHIGQVGVIGGGQMGNGIAHVCALAGLPVVLLDVKQDALDRALATMARNMERQVNRSIITSEERDAALARISASTDYEAFGDTDLVIEAATEKEDIKRSIFAALTPKLKKSAVIASNTSSLSITRLGAST